MLERAALFEETTVRTRLSNPTIVEKDFWVCWALCQLFARDVPPRLLLKGGTSLSKGFGLIHRFSEDIDIGLQRADIGLVGDLDPMTKNSRKSSQRALKAMSARVSEYVTSSFLPAVRDTFHETLGEDCDLRLEVNGTENVLTFRYPRALAPSAYDTGSYVASLVRLELGARADHWPTSEVDVGPYAAEQFPEAFERPKCRVIAQAPERTLLEKALILHTSLCRGRFKPQSSRHGYDLAKLHRAGTMKRVTRELFEEVARHKFVFGDDKHAGEAPTTGIKLVPAGELLRALESDYRSMQPMLFAHPPPPTFAEVLIELRRLESELGTL